MDIENLAKELILKNMTPEQQMAVLESVRQSVANAKEVQKKKIGENVDLVVQALKKIESDIRDRFDAVGNSIEKRVLSIQDGRDGANGTDGRDGKDGKSGRDGLKGDRGVDGQAGRDGVDGVDGISVVNAQIDFDGSLVITLSDGRELNVGEVVSQDIAEKIKVISTMSTNGAVAVKEEGTTLTNGVKSINFVGTGITATTSGDDVTVTVASGSGTVTSVAATAGTGISITGSPITTSGTLNITNTAPDQTVALTQGGTTTITGTYPNFTISSADQFQGTVTSVTGTSPVVSSGGATPAISLAANYGDTQNPYASKTANFVLAAPNGSAGVPTFRAVVAADIPTLNQSTTGNAATVTTNANLTGAVTSVGNATSLGSFTSAELATALTDETGTGVNVFATSPTITTPTISSLSSASATALTLQSAGTTAITVSTSQNVGIGTTSPGYRLDVPSADTATGNAARFRSNATAAKVRLQFTDSAASAQTGYIEAGDTPYLAFGINAEYLRITNAGDVGIGTTTPSTYLGKTAIYTANGVTSFTTDATIRLIAPSSAAGIQNNKIQWVNENQAGVMAQIVAIREAVPAAPGALAFYTSPNVDANGFTPLERFRISSTGAFSAVIPSGTTLFPAFMCRAWVNFNGTGTVAIRGNGNVSSITDNGVGSYVVNFTTAMPDTNFVVVSGNGNNAVANTVGNTNDISSASSTPFLHYEAGALRDVALLYCAVFR
jgi:hypothetical protein